MCRGFNFEECAEVAFSINVKFCGMVSTMLYSIDDNLNHFEGSKFQCKQAKMQKMKVGSEGLHFWSYWMASFTGLPILTIYVAKFSDS